MGLGSGPGPGLGLGLKSGSGIEAGKIFPSVAVGVMFPEDLCAITQRHVYRRVWRRRAERPHRGTAGPHPSGPPKRCSEAQGAIMRRHEVASSRLWPALPLRGQTTTLTKLEHVPCHELTECATARVRLREDEHLHTWGCSLE